LAEQNLHGVMLVALHAALSSGCVATSLPLFAAGG